MNDEEPTAATTPERVVGVGPWVGPWPEDPRYDPELLREGDRRNVEDRFRYFSNAAVVAELDTRRNPLHVAVENWQHDLNIGSVVRTANAVNVAGVHIVGQRRWNRRGAMVTDRYLDVSHHEDVAALVAWAGARKLPVVGIDNVEGSVPLETYDLPRECVMLFGQEGPGLSEEAVAACVAVLAISQFGSTRSINVGAAAAVAMHAWVRRHVFDQRVDGS
ncbi:TrmH family RNA methyltransferase [Kineococcus gynurae]|uniref:TrmH family RNA methyltransferase n=1 Tax=Kineococcus gynurae TaxID=452979 RepID=A0ABV5LS89_9ACTN